MRTSLKTLKKFVIDGDKQFKAKVEKQVSFYLTFTVQCNDINVIYNVKVMHFYKSHLTFMTTVRCNPDLLSCLL